MKSPDVTIVIPTFNEADNVRAMYDKISVALADWNWEIIYVDDDSPDNTADLVAKLAENEPRVRLIRRIGRRGLSSASIEGFMASTAEYIGLIDADGQHDERILPQMLRTLRSESLDLVIGSRYVGDGSADGLANAGRVWASRFATRLSSLVMKESVTDPMSGYFVMNRQYLEKSVRNVSGKGYKILLDLITSNSEPLRFKEIPYNFRERMAGDSKLDTNVAAEYVLMLLDKAIGEIIPARFIMFILSGCLGAVMHLCVLGITLLTLDWPFVYGQLLASGMAMILNFGVNNKFTYHDKKLKGSALFPALVKFMLICSVGAVTNLAVATTMFDHNVVWWLSGLVGAGIGAVWNYAVSSTLTWRVLK
ncbi:glycosyltransferase [Cerasicoccus maritimus]|uniref:glycosyltransferase n=1 Tax=Cerasicoccus maritimus TaxID=490089 RepID=UPI002852C496|nr:glycosyltransferase [Cerasicoccus maritimus]